MMAETVSLGLGPSLRRSASRKKERVDPRGGHPLRVAIAEWMGALGFAGDFDLYIGGPRAARRLRRRRRAAGARPRQPGHACRSTRGARSAVAREVFAFRRGITAVRTRDENTRSPRWRSPPATRSGSPCPAPATPSSARWRARSTRRSPRKVKKIILEPCQRFARSGQDARVLGRPRAAEHRSDGGHRGVATCRSSSASFSACRATELGRVSCGQRSRPAPARLRAFSRLPRASQEARHGGAVSNGRDPKGAGEGQKPTVPPAFGGGGSPRPSSTSTTTALRSPTSPRS